MKDFRYHLTSLAAVFLALAIGVVLGAGPLQANLSGALGGKVTTLQEQNDLLNRKVESLDKQNAANGNFISKLSSQVNQGSLAGRKIAVISFAGVPSAEVDKVVQTLSTSGAQIAGKAELGVGFTSPDFVQYRTSLAPRLPQYLEAKPDASASAESILAQAVMAVLQKGAEPSKSLVEILGAPENPLATFKDANGGAEAAVIITGDLSLSSGSTEGPVSGDQASAISDSVSAFAHFPKSAVALGSAASEGNVLSILREQSVAVTTIDSFPSARSLASLPPALLLAGNTPVALGSEIGAALPAPQLPKR
ncbi:copper transporter [Actinomycetaceae bacterium TAE3-ERU4]|nr:copper transporter [Actinomycetaceae bacterium TAE3-ERU4]